METKIEALIAKMEGARSVLNTALEKVTPQAEIYPTWKLKQLLDHFTGWDELVLAELRAYQNGVTPTQTVHSVDRFNAESVLARKLLSLEQSRQAYDSTRQAMLETLRSMPDEMVTREYKAPWGGKCTIASIVRIFVSHEREHAEQIEKDLHHAKASPQG